MDFLDFKGLVAGAASAKYSTAALIATNLIPFVGVAFLGWDRAAVLLAYWAESAVIGFYTVLKMALARGQLAMKLFMIPFFCLHFGGFMLGHLIFILVLSSGVFSGEGGAAFSFGTLKQRLFEVLVFAAGALASHGISFKANFLARERESASVHALLSAPYPRIILMHLAIILGGFLGAPALLLVVLKTFFDLRAHLRERKRFSEGNASDQASFLF